MSSKTDFDTAQIELDKLYNETTINPPIGVPKNVQETLQYLHKQIIRGWRIIFSHNIVHENNKKCKIYILTAQLYPEGRGSTLEDWNFIGQVTGYIERRINQDNNNDIHYSLLTPIETTHPNDIYKWYWIAKTDLIQ